MHRRRPLKVLVIALAALSATALAACGGDDSSAAGTTGSAATTGGATTGEASGEPVTLRLGYFANVTHATPLVGVSEGLYEEALGANVTLETAIFNAGPAEIEALFAEAIDAGYIGPNPAVNGFVQSKGDALRIVSGATSGGAFLVVEPGITSAAALAGKVLATPSLGNTQDVALRAYLKENGLNADTSGGGDVSIRPQENAATLDAFKAGDIDGAWVPEPWATRLVIEGGGEVLVDERDLWPDGRFTTTVLIVSKSFLDDHPDVVKRLIEGQLATEAFIDANEVEAQTIVNDQIEAITEKRMDDEVLRRAWTSLDFTSDPVASSVLQSAADAADVGLLREVPDLTELFDLALLNELLAAEGEPAVSGV